MFVLLICLPSCVCCTAHLVSCLYTELEAGRRESVDENQRALNEHLSNVASELRDFLDATKKEMPAAQEAGDFVVGGKRRAPTETPDLSAPAAKRSKLDAAARKAGEDASCENLLCA